jgi:putative hemolysin
MLWTLARLRGYTAAVLMLLAQAATEPAAWGWLGLVLQSVLLLVLVCLSGAFSGSEAVLFSLTPAQIQHDAQSSNPLRRLVTQVMQRPDHTLMMILVANTAVNVLLFSSSYVLFSHLAAQYGDWIQLVAAVFSVLVVIVFGEVIPKVLGVTLADRLAPFSALLVKVAGYPFGIVGNLVDWLMVKPIDRLFFPTAERGPGAHEISPEELRTLLEMNRRRGLLSATEDALMREVIKLNDILVRDVMVPRVEITAFDLRQGRGALLRLMRETRLRKVPVYSGDIDQIRGLIYAKVLILNPDQPLEQLITPVRFIPELITCEQALHHFRAHRSQLAIAVDEFGGVAGLVAVEDVLEQIVGDIRDPDEALELPEVVRLSESDYEISGALSIHFWAETFGLQRLEDRVATVGGLVTSRLGRAARVGDVIQIGNLELRVTQLGHRRIERLRLRLLPRAREEGAA